MKLLKFGVAKEIIASEIDLTSEEISTVGELRSLLSRRFPDIDHIAGYMIAVNKVYAKDNLPLNKTDEIAIIPPVSGG